MLMDLKLQFHKHLKDLINKLEFIFGVNVYGGSVNAAICRRLGLKIKKDTPLLVLSYCFNHCLELAIKDAVSVTFLTNWM